MSGPIISNHSQVKILVADKDYLLSQIIKTRLLKSGFDVIFASNGKEALYLFRKEQPQLVILDILLPVFNCYIICDEMRKTSNIPIIMLTACEDISDRIIAFRLGADDYLTKPFSIKELEARVNSLLRRFEIQTNLPPFFSKQKYFQFGTITINLQKRQVFKGISQIKLTNMEFNLLELLVNNIGEPLSRSLILIHVWGYSPKRYLDTRVVDVQISRLRSKLEDDPTNPNLIITTRGIGYMFQK
jgi:OmpR family response regulator RpaB